MKKIYTSCLIIILCLVLVSCDLADTPLEKDSQQETEEPSGAGSNTGDVSQGTVNEVPQNSESDVQHSTENELSSEPSDAENSEQLFDISLLENNNEDYDIFKDSQSVDWGATSFQDKSASPSLEITILGNDYELEYLESAYLPLNAFPVHTYKIKGTEYSKILICAQTGKIVKYSNIPIKVSYKTEQEYKAFIQELVGQQYELADYQYKCTTWRYIFTDTSMRSNVEDGFFVCANNEKLASYSFYFDKEIGGIKTLEHISAEFSEDSFSLEIYDFNYENNTFIRILNAMNALQIELRNYLGSEVSEGFIITNTNVISHTLFIRNGIPYVNSCVDVEYSRENENDKYVQRVQTIIGLKSE